MQYAHIAFTRYSGYTDLRCGENCYTTSFTNHSFYNGEKNSENRSIFHQISQSSFYRHGVGYWQLSGVCKFIQNFDRVYVFVHCVYIVLHCSYREWNWGTWTWRVINVNRCWLLLNVTDWCWLHDRLRANKVIQPSDCDYLYHYSGASTLWAKQSTMLHRNLTGE